MYSRANSKYKPARGDRQIPSTRGDLTEGFLRYDFGGLIFGGAYFRNVTVVFYSLTVDVVFSCFYCLFFFFLTDCYVFDFLDVFVSLFSLSRTETI